ncbi:MAG: hypothetical protein V3T61_05510 [Acidobacteriota bacterium]
MIFLKRAGYALVAVALVFLTFVSAIPELRVPHLVFYSYLLLGVGGVSVLLFKSLEIIQHSRLRRRAAYCSECGWLGRLDDWFRYHCCPDCDSENVVLM